MTGHLILFCLSFVGMFLRGHQTQVIMRGRVLHAFIISWLITLSAVTTLLLTVNTGYIAIIPSGLGSSLGICYSIYLNKKKGDTLE